LFALTLLLGETGGSGSLTPLADLLETREVRLCLRRLARGLQLGVALLRGLLFGRLAVGVSFGPARNNWGLKLWVAKRDKTLRANGAETG
jgi:hypothetical protein